MSEVPPPRLHNNGPWPREIGVTVVKGIIYSLVFWAVYRAAYWAWPAQSSSASNGPSYEQQMKTYDEQTKRTNKMFTDQENIQARYEALISRQEEQVKRLDVILDSWERQARIRK